MLGKRSILIFLLSVNIFAQMSLVDELKELHEASSSIELSDWTELTAKAQQKVVTEDSIGLSSSALKKPITLEAPEESNASIEEIGQIRYRSR